MKIGIIGAMDVEVAYLKEQMNVKNVVKKALIFMIKNVMYVKKVIMKWNPLLLLHHLQL